MEVHRLSGIGQKFLIRGTLEERDEADQYRDEEVWEEVVGETFHEGEFAITIRKKCRI